MSKPRRQLVGMIYAESSTPNAGGGEFHEEKVGIGQTIGNRTFYATMTPPPPATSCYNSEYGNGTVWSALSSSGQFQAFGGSRWNEVMNGDDLKQPAALNQSMRRISDRQHFNLSVEAVREVDIGLGLVPELLDAKPIAFQQSAQAGSPRWQLSGKLGAHHFFSFAPGRECQ